MVDARRLASDVTYTSWRTRSTPAARPPVSSSQRLRREFHETLLEAASFEDLPGKWQAPVLKTEQTRPELRVVTRNLVE